MDVGLVQAVRQDSAGEVRVALEVKRGAADELIHVWVAACSEQVVDAAADLIDAVRRQRILTQVEQFKGMLVVTFVSQGSDVQQ